MVYKLAYEGVGRKKVHCSVAVKAVCKGGMCTVQLNAACKKMGAEPKVGKGGRRSHYQNDFLLLVEARN